MIKIIKLKCNLKLNAFNLFSLSKAQNNKKKTVWKYY